MQENNRYSFTIDGMDSNGQAPPPQNQPPKKRGGRRIAANLGKAFLALVLVAGISAGSVAGYIWLSGNGAAPVSQQGDLTAGDSTTAPSTQGTKTNYVLGSTEEALTTPEIFVKASPWVVSISCEVVTSGYPGGFGGYFGPSTGTAGTGIIMSADGYIITNHHVIEDATSIRVTTSGNKEYTATLVGSDEKTDIAVLKIDATGLSPAEFGDSTQLVVGEPAIVIGNPLGTDLADTLTQGVISSVERQVRFTDSNGAAFYMNLVQTDAAVNPGNSGGPLINSRGQVVGVINSKIAQEDVEGIGFAIPSATALSIANDLIENGVVTIRPVLGITIYAFSSGEADNYNAMYQDDIKAGLKPSASQGIIVMSVTPGSAADQAGMLMGDKITAFNGVKVASSSELNFEKEKCKVGDTATITIERGGQQLDLEVTFMPGVSA